MKRLKKVLFFIFCIPSISCIAKSGYHQSFINQSNDSLRAASLVLSNLHAISFYTVVPKSHFEDHLKKNEKVMSQKLFLHIVKLQSSYLYISFLEQIISSPSLNLLKEGATLLELAYLYMKIDPPKLEKLLSHSSNFYLNMTAPNLTKPMLNKNEASSLLLNRIELPYLQDILHLLASSSFLPPSYQQCNPNTPVRDCLTIVIVSLLHSLHLQLSFYRAAFPVLNKLFFDPFGKVLTPRVSLIIRYLQNSNNFYSRHSKGADSALNTLKSSYESWSYFSERRLVLNSFLTSLSSTNASLRLFESLNAKELIFNDSSHSILFHNNPFDFDEHSETPSSLERPLHSEKVFSRDEEEQGTEGPPGLMTKKKMTESSDVKESNQKEENDDKKGRIRSKENYTSLESEQRSNETNKKQIAMTLHKMKEQDLQKLLSFHEDEYSDDVFNEKAPVAVRRSFYSVNKRLEHKYISRKRKKPRIANSYYSYTPYGHRVPSFVSQDMGASTSQQQYFPSSLLHMSPGKDSVPIRPNQIDNGHTSRKASQSPMNSIVLEEKSRLPSPLRQNDAESRINTKRPYDNTIDGPSPEEEARPAPDFGSVEAPYIGSFQRIAEVQLDDFKQKQFSRRGRLPSLLDFSPHRLHGKNDATPHKGYPVLSPILSVLGMARESVLTEESANDKSIPLFLVSFLSHHLEPWIRLKWDLLNLLRYFYNDLCIQKHPLVLFPSGLRSIIPSLCFISTPSFSFKTHESFAKQRKMKTVTEQGLLLSALLNVYKLLNKGSNIHDNPLRKIRKEIGLNSAMRLTKRRHMYIRVASMRYKELESRTMHEWDRYFDTAEDRMELLDPLRRVCGVAPKKNEATSWNKWHKNPIPKPVGRPKNRNDNTSVLVRGSTILMSRRQKKKGVNEREPEPKDERDIEKDETIDGLASEAAQEDENESDMNFVRESEISNLQDDEENDMTQSFIDVSLDKTERRETSIIYDASHSLDTLSPSRPVHPSLPLLPLHLDNIPEGLGEGISHAFKGDRKSSIATIPDLSQRGNKYSLRPSRKNSSAFSSSEPSKIHYSLCRSVFLLQTRDFLRSSHPINRYDGHKYLSGVAKKRKLTFSDYSKLLVHSWKNSDFLVSSLREEISHLSLLSFPLRNSADFTIRPVKKTSEYARLIANSILLASIVMKDNQQYRSASNREYTVKFLPLWEGMRLFEYFYREGKMEGAAIDSPHDSRASESKQAEVLSGDELFREVRREGFRIREVNEEERNAHNSYDSSPLSTETLDAALPRFGRVNNDRRTVFDFSEEVIESQIWTEEEQIAMRRLSLGASDSSGLERATKIPKRLNSATQLDSPERRPSTSEEYQTRSESKGEENVARRKWRRHTLTHLDDNFTSAHGEHSVSNYMGTIERILNKNKEDFVVENNGQVLSIYSHLGASPVESGVEEKLNIPSELKDTAFSYWKRLVTQGEMVKTSLLSLISYVPPSRQIMDFFHEGYSLSGYFFRELLLQKYPKFAELLYPNTPSDKREEEKEREQLGGGSIKNQPERTEQKTERKSKSDKEKATDGEIERNKRTTEEGDELTPDSKRLNLESVSRSSQEARTIRLAVGVSKEVSVKATVLDITQKEELLHELHNILMSNQKDTLSYLKTTQFNGYYSVFPITRNVASIEGSQRNNLLYIIFILTSFVATWIILLIQMCQSGRNISRGKNSAHQSLSPVDVCLS